MKKRLYLLMEFLYFIFAAVPIFLVVISTIYIGSFFHDIYTSTKILCKNFSKR